MTPSSPLLPAPPGRGPRRRDRPAFELLLSRRARERYGLTEAPFAFDGGLVFADAGEARRLARRLGPLSREALLTAGPATPGRLFALGLIHELLHAAVAEYRRQQGPEVMSRALAWLAGRLGPERLDTTLEAFVEEFPPVAVFRGELSTGEYLAGESGGLPHRQVVLEELLILWLANENPAAAPFRELFDDAELRRRTAYPEVASGLEEFLRDEPPAGVAGVLGEPGPSLVEALRAPVREAPESLSGQLEFLRQGLSHRTGPQLDRLLRGADVLREEERPVFPPGPGPVEVPDPAAEAVGPERFTPDRAWMPELVLLAKNVNVWLGQLSQRYGRAIATLDAIPDEELDLLASWGVTGLWLIGLWQRSRASEAIKRLAGNPEAAASAYSLAAYRIAPELGGEEALTDLRERAGRRGIRLGSDMVPNHMGIDSEWVMEHPERFLSLPRPPFDSYTFNGPNLSDDPRVALHLEDHYYDRTDAAVVFERVDRTTGEVRYLYHGNDGTSTPWNDTAQLDFLDPRTREAVSDTILRVAKLFPIVRFDAAMVLAKRHVRRLWYPPPGSGGAIPSRSEHGLTSAEFDARMPREFWREVVDRAAREAPDTLLLAEAFWLMESYFVRTLGMHRVYNSAFMHMLRDERNADYREALKKTLAFDPEILKRYVNFLSNPDERTAIDQFGAGDKYFGVATLMATLPGLPMLAHGQVEGLTEKYGMEYRRARVAERPKRWLVERHERQIFPLLKRRRLFAGSERFRLFDFETAAGVDENVLALTNREGGDRGGGHRDGGEAALVVCHNAGGSTRGWLRRSVPVAEKSREGGRRLHREGLGRALGIRLTGAPAGQGEAFRPHLVTCRDEATGLEHLFDGRELATRGLELTLGPYEHHAFVGFAPVAKEDAERFGALARALEGRGVPSLADALLEPELLHLLRPFRDLVEPALLHRLAEAGGAGTDGGEDGERDGDSELLGEVEGRLRRVLRALADHLEEAPPEHGTAKSAPPAARPAGPDSQSPDRAAIASLVACVREELDAGLTLLASLRPAGEPVPEDVPGGEAENATGPDADAHTRAAAERDGDSDVAGSARAAAGPGDDPDSAAHAQASPGLDQAAAGAQAAPGIEANPDAPADARTFLVAGMEDDPAVAAVLAVWLTVRRLGEIAGAGPAAARSRAWLDDLLLGKQIAASLGALGLGEEAVGDTLALLKVLVAGKLPPSSESPPVHGATEPVPVPPAPEAVEPSQGTAVPQAAAGLAQHAGPSSALATWLGEPDVQVCLRLHRFEATLWLHRESLERLLWWGVLAAALESGSGSPEAVAAARSAAALSRAAEAAGYRLEALLTPPGNPGSAAPPPPRG